MYVMWTHLLKGQTPQPPQVQLILMADCSSRGIMEEHLRYLLVTPAAWLQELPQDLPTSPGSSHFSLFSRPIPQRKNHGQRTSVKGAKLVSSWARRAPSCWSILLVGHPVGVQILAIPLGHQLHGAADAQAACKADHNEGELAMLADGCAWKSSDRPTSASVLDR